MKRRRDHGTLVVRGLMIPIRSKHVANALQALQAENNELRVLLDQHKLLVEALRVELAHYKTTDPLDDTAETPQPCPPP